MGSRSTRLISRSYLLSQPQSTPLSAQGQWPSMGKEAFKFNSTIIIISNF